MLVCNETAAHRYNQCYVDPIIQGSDSAPVCGVYRCLRVVYLEYILVASTTVLPQSVASTIPTVSLQVLFQLL